ncbi:MAG: hypothetical protein MR434_10715, partial [Ruminococcus sp.]|nr:hypothetical protein [Ruminococcus sp.]
DDIAIFAVIFSALTAEEKLHRTKRAYQLCAVLHYYFVSQTEGSIAGMVRKASLRWLYCFIFVAGRCPTPYQRLCLWTPPKG